MNFPNTSFSVTKCKVKLLRHDRLFVDVEGSIHHTITSAFVHFRVFYKFSSNEYRPLLFDVWEDFCAYMNGAKNNIIFNRWYPKFRQYISFNHSCPYHPGMLLVKMSNVSLDIFTPIQFVPSGRYRIDVSVHDSYKGTCVFMLKVYAGISS